jgi:N6-L-threonylcarbamoyladenine synthase
MRILAIETSCDDTCVAVLEIKDSTPHQKFRFGTGHGFKILSNIVSSQVKLHSKYGGIWPFLAKREHQRNLPIILIKALKESKLLKISKSEFLISKQIPISKYQIPKIDLIAVTNGPGLEPCLWVGVNFSKKLAKNWNMPIVPVNHIEAHVLANFINSKYLIQNTKYLFPAICLVVSGGHTQLILMRGFGSYKILGETRDDAAGECLDKTARILGLGYPGGPAIAAEAAKFKVRDSKFKVQLPRPMIHHKNYDFSFSGLKTAVLYLVKQLTEDGKKLTISQKREISAEIQQAVIDVLIHKTLKATKDYRAKSIILGGGVASNQELRKQFAKRIKKEIPNTKYIIPDTKYCTDNAAMTAVTAYFRFTPVPEISFRYGAGISDLKFKNNWKNIKANANLRLG